MREEKSDDAKNDCEWDSVLLPSALSFHLPCAPLGLSASLCLLHRGAFCA